MKECENLVSSVNTVVSRIVTLLHDPEFRTALRDVATAILKILPDDPAAKQAVAATDTSGDKATNTGDDKADFQQCVGQMPSSAGQASPSVDDEAPTAPFDHPAQEPPTRSTDTDVEPAANQNLHHGQREYNPPTKLTAKMAEFIQSASVIEGDQSPAQLASNQPEEPSVDTLELITKRCLLKAEAARWAAKRRRLMREGANFQTEIAPQDADIIQRAKELKRCFLWTNHPQCPEPPDENYFPQLADTFDNLANAVALATMIESDKNLSTFLKRATLLIAESQSAVRYARALLSNSAGYADYDTDQQTTFQWLREVTQNKDFYIDRYMQIDDSALPENADDLAARIRELKSQLQERQQQQRTIRKLMDKIKYETSLLSQKGDNSISRLHTLVRALDELVPDLIPPSNAQLRSYLLPVLPYLEEIELDDMERAHRGTYLTLCALEEYIAQHPDDDPDSQASPQPSTIDLELREYLRGKSMLMIGGEQRKPRQEAIRAAFDLKELVWESVAPHTSLREFESKIAHVDVAIVLLAIRWSSHVYAGLDEICRKHGKLLVRLPAGTNASQIAYQIDRQIGNTLKNQSLGA